MFYTFPEAELLIPQQIAPNGERAWHWLELGLKMTYYFSTIRAATDDGEGFIRHHWFSSIDPVLDIAKMSSDHLTLVRLDALTPSHVNGTDAFRFDRLHKVWRDKTRANFKFLLADGTILLQNISSEKSDESSMELILSL